MKEHHDVPLIGHLGVHQTMDHIKRALWWKGLWGDVGQYVRSCLGLSTHEVRPQEKGGFIVANPPTRTEMAADYD